MSTYNNNRFTPGNKANMRLFINKAFIRQYYKAFNTSDNADDMSDDTLCSCIPPQTKSLKQGWNDSTQTENTRVAQILTGTLGGKITYGLNNRPASVNYLGGWEGQPGGIPRPLRNKF